MLSNYYLIQIVRILNIIYIVIIKINLSFDYIKKSKHNNNSNLSLNTYEEEININNISKKEELIEINFHNSILQFSDIKAEEDFINIFIEINKAKLLNKNNNSYYSFLFNLKDNDKEKNISLKIENLFHLSFNSVYYKISNNINNNSDENLLGESLNDSILSTDSNHDYYDSEVNREDKIKDMKKAKNLFGRIRNVTKLLRFKSSFIDDIFKHSQSKDINIDFDQEISLDNIMKEPKESENKTISNTTKEKRILKGNKDLKNIKIEKDYKKKDSKFLKKEEFYKDKTTSFSCKNIFNGAIENKTNYFLERKKRILTLEEKEDYDNILSSITYDLYLKEQNELKNNNEDYAIRETFCSGFFITSFPQKNASIIEKSEDLPASCSHKACSVLKSMKPEIIMRYPLKDTEEVEINNMAATLCFPTGIKLCHSENELKPHKMKDYLTLITNRLGNRLYIMTFHFYLKMKMSEFDKKYEKYPLKFKLVELNQKIKEVDFDKINDLTFNIFEEMKICKEFESRTNVHIPYCLALISKYPYIKQMKQSIKCIFKIIEKQANDNNFKLNELLMYLIHSIPIPNINSFIKFPLPYISIEEQINKKNNLIMIEPPKFKDMNILNCNICELLNIFRIKNIIRIFRLLLFEKKIIFIDDDYSRLSNVMNSFLSLIYPFQWPHVYIPIMTIPMIKYLETFLPFLVGIHSSFIPHIKTILSKNSNEKEQVYLIFVGEDKIRISDFFKEDKKMKKSHFLHKNLTNLPIWAYILLEHLLKGIKSKMKSIKNEEVQQLNFEMQNSFIEIFVEMFADYNKYIYLVGEDAIFNRNLFLSKRSVFEKKFFNEFLDTQMFLQFKEDILGDGFEYFKLKVSERNSDYNKEILRQTILEKTRTFVNDNNQEIKLYVINHQFKTLIKEDQNKTGNNNKNYIITYLNSFENEEYDNSKCIIYLMPTFQTIGFMVKESNIIPQKPNNNPKNSSKKTEEERKKQFQIYKTQEQIKDYILHIFKSDINKNENDLKNIIKMLTNEEIARDCFIKLISKNISKVVLLPKNSFDALYNLIFETLLALILQLESSDHLFKEGVLLVKSMMNYGKEEKNKIITIWDLCKEKLMENSLIYEQKFWHEWYLFEINNNINLNGDLLNDVKYEAMISISKTMKEFNIDKSVIIYYTNQLIKKNFGNDLDLIQKTQNDIKCI